MTTNTVHAGDRVQSLIEITQSLSAIFEQENSLLKSERPREIAPLQADKARLAAAYAQSIKDIAADRGLIDGADSTLLAALKDMTREFEQRAAHQKALLDGARRASEGVLRAVADEAAAETATTAYRPLTDAKTTAPTPISLNEEA